MKIETKFDMGQRVFIVDAGYQPAKIDLIKIVGKNLVYGVYYWTDGKLQAVDISEEEIVADVPSGKGPGFK